jgi:hypothetical protein
MGHVFWVVFTIIALLFPFVMMPLLWRRMKRVRSEAYRRTLRDKQHEAPWQEAIETRDGVDLTRASSPNDALIDLGDRGRHARWPLDSA